MYDEQDHSIFFFGIKIKDWMHIFLKFMMQA